MIRWAKVAKSKSDSELMGALQIDANTLEMFKRVRENALKDARTMDARKNVEIRVLGISGSARDVVETSQEDSNSEELLKRCLEYCREFGAETELIQLSYYSLGLG